MTGFRILVVDDDKEDHLILQDYFKGSDIAIHYLDTGRAALDYLESIPNDKDLPSLIVLDLNMPLLSGTDTLIHIKRQTRFRNIPVIIYSTSENETEKRKCLSFGAIDYVVKPMSFDEGEKIVKKFSAFVIDKPLSTH